MESGFQIQTPCDESDAIEPSRLNPTAPYMSFLNDGYHPGNNMPPPVSVTHEIRFESARNEADDPVITPNFHYVAMRTSDTSFEVWDVERRVQHRFDLGNFGPSVGLAAMSSDGRFIAVALDNSDNETRVWRVDDGLQVASFHTPFEVAGIALTAEGREIALSGSVPVPDEAAREDSDDEEADLHQWNHCYVTIRHVHTGRVVRSLEFFSKFVSEVRFSRSDRILSIDASPARIWKWDAGQVFVCPDRNCNQPVLNPADDGVVATTWGQGGEAVSRWRDWAKGAAVPLWLDKEANLEQGYLPRFSDDGSALVYLTREREIRRAFWGLGDGFETIVRLDADISTFAVDSRGILVAVAYESEVLALILNPMRACGGRVVRNR